MRSPTVLLSVSVCLAAAALVGGCGSDNQAGGTPGTADATPGSIEIAAVLPAFEYYGACGNARFQSDSGRVVWLTDEEQTYNWVC